MAPLNTPLDVYKLLPQSNCGACYVPSCLAFSAAVIRGDKGLADCPYIDNEVIDQFADKIHTRRTVDQQRKNQLETLKSQITTIDLPSSAKRLGAVMIDGKLAIKCLGKNFLVDNRGNITSECHTHTGLTIPLLTYIISSKGTGISGEWVHFRELRNGTEMSPLFSRRAEKTLKQLADSHTDLFEILIDIFSGQKSDNDYSADMSLVLFPLPRVPIQVCYWRAESDLESELNIFFDATAENHIPIDSIFALGTGLVMMFEKIAQKHC